MIAVTSQKRGVDATGEAVMSSNDGRVIFHRLIIFGCF